jgi:hypothetical protein
MPWVLIPADLPRKAAAGHMYRKVPRAVLALRGNEGSSYSVRLSAECLKAPVLATISFEFRFTTTKAGPVVCHASVVGTM